MRGPRGAFILCDEEHTRSINRAVFPFTQGGPMMHTIAAKAVCFGEAQTEEFREYQRSVAANARTLAGELEAGGLRIVSGGTDNHLLLVDVTPLGLTGQEAEDALGQVHITVNKNAIPFDPKPPRVTSGLRLGTPAVSSRGFGREEMTRVASFIVRVLTHPGDQEVEGQVRKEVVELTSQYAVPGLEGYA